MMDEKKNDDLVGLLEIGQVMADGQSVPMFEVVEDTPLGVKVRAGEHDAFWFWRRVNVLEADVNEWERRGFRVLHGARHSNRLKIGSEFVNTYRMERCREIHGKKARERRGMFALAVEWMLGKGGFGLKYMDGWQVLIAGGGVEVVDERVE